MRSFDLLASGFMLANSWQALGEAENEGKAVFVALEDALQKASTVFKAGEIKDWFSSLSTKQFESRTLFHVSAFEPFSRFPVFYNFSPSLCAEVFEPEVFKSFSAVKELVDPERLSLQGIDRLYAKMRRVIQILLQKFNPFYPSGPRSQEEEGGQEQEVQQVRELVSKIRYMEESDADLHEAIELFLVLYRYFTRRNPALNVDQGQNLEPASAKDDTIQCDQYSGELTSFELYQVAKNERILKDCFGELKRSRRQLKEREILKFQFDIVLALAELLAKTNSNTEAFPRNEGRVEVEGGFM